MCDVAEKYDTAMEGFSLEAVPPHSSDGIPKAPAIASVRKSKEPKHSETPLIITAKEKARTYLCRYG